jgi:hypothetical protein
MIRASTMSLSTSTSKTAIGPTLARPLVQAGGVVDGLGRTASNATATISRGIVILFSYRAALKRLEAGVEGDLFDDPLLWAELKSAAWAEAGAVAAARSKARPM